MKSENQLRLPEDINIAVDDSKKNDEQNKPRTTT